MNSIVGLVLVFNVPGLIFASIGIWAALKLRRDDAPISVNSGFFTPALLFGLIGFVLNVWIWAPFNIAETIWPFWSNYVGAFVWVAILILVRYLVIVSMVDKVSKK